eukprot:212274_1
MSQSKQFQERHKKLLVFGYIRENYKDEVPLELCRLCFSFSYYFDLQIFINGPYGKHYVLDTKLSDTIYDLKEQIQDKTAISTSHQFLRFGWRVLDDEKQIFSYDILKGST